MIRLFRQRKQNLQALSRREWALLGVSMEKEVLGLWLVTWDFIPRAVVV